MVFPYCPGFGNWKPKKVKAGELKHIKTGEMLKYPESMTVSFTAGTESGPSNFSHHLIIVYPVHFAPLSALVHESTTEATELNACRFH